MHRRTPSYPFRKPRDLQPEILQRILDDEQKLAATRAKLAAEQLATHQPTDQPSTPAHRGGTAPSHHQTQNSKETTSMSAHSPELQDGLQSEMNETQSRVESPSNGNSNGTAEDPERSRRTENPQSHRTVEDPEDPAHPESSRGERTRTVEDPERTRRNRTTTDQPTRVARGSFSEGGPNFIHHPPDLARHRRKCSICRHPERDTIEDLFIHWHSPNTIANYFDDAAEDAGDDSANRLRITWVAIYRHAYAVGLDEVRRRNLRFAFEHILEQAGDITPTSASIMAAARAYAACVNTDGHWNDPPKQVIVTNIIKNESSLHSPEGCHPEPGRPSLANGGEGPVSVPAADIVAAGLPRHGSFVEFAGAPSSAPVAEGGETPASNVQSPSTHCHSEGGCDQHPTRNLHFGPFSESAAEIRIPPNSLITNDREISNR